MAKKATSNYTPEMTVRMVEAYEACGKSDSEADQLQRANVVTEFATEFDFHEASIRGKLVREGVYIAKKTLTKQGGKVESKEAIVDEIAKLLDMTAEACGSLTKGNKAVLQAVRDALTPEPVQEEGEEGETA